MYNKRKHSSPSPGTEEVYLTVLCSSWMAGTMWQCDCVGIIPTKWWGRGLACWRAHARSHEEGFSSLGLFKKKGTFCTQNPPLKQLSRMQPLKIFATVIYWKSNISHSGVKPSFSFHVSCAYWQKQRWEWQRGIVPQWLLNPGGTGFMDRM